MEKYSQCAGVCTCEGGPNYAPRIEDNISHTCKYGDCSGYKCLSCGKWTVSCIGENCSLFSEQEIAETNTEFFKKVFKMRHYK